MLISVMPVPQESLVIQNFFSSGVSACKFVIQIFLTIHIQYRPLYDHHTVLSGSTVLFRLRHSNRVLPGGHNLLFGLVTSPFVQCFFCFHFCHLFIWLLWFPLCVYAVVLLVWFTIDVNSGSDVCYCLWQIDANSKNGFFVSFFFRSPCSFS